MTVPRLRVLAISALFLTVAGCGGAENEPRSAPRPADAAVVVTRSGGIAGVNDTITVAPQGQWTRVDRAGAHRTGRLTDDERARLRTLAADPDLVTGAGSPTAATNCADGFSYTVSAGATRVAYVDCPGQPSRPRAAVSIVELLMAATG